MKRAMFANWMAKNPLIKFREKEAIPRIQLASMISVSQNSIQFWENGSSLPSGENFHKLSLAMNMGKKELVEEWKEWYNKKPSIEELSS